MNKRCIFHIPFCIDENVASGSNIRPIKIIESLKETGYQVDVVKGYGKERKKNIKNIKRNIENGIKYDFIYSESSTEPTLLTEKNHIPRYLNLDFGFIKYCRENGIKVGLFYRDIHWKFLQYKNSVSFLKRLISKLFYIYDLIRYKNLADIFYLPSFEMYKYLNVKYKMKIDVLPPGADNKIIDRKACDEEKLTIFYVGGISEELYNLQLLFDVVNELSFVHLVVCCRENEWNKNKSNYEGYKNGRITIVHEYGDNIIEYAKEADILNLFIKPVAYWEFAVPIKLFTYISLNRPIISVNNTVVGKFIQENNIGWSLDYNENSIKDFLLNITKVKIEEKAANIPLVKNNNTWKKRAEKIIEDLSPRGEL